MVWPNLIRFGRTCPPIRNPASLILRLAFRHRLLDNIRPLLVTPPVILSPLTHSNLVIRRRNRSPVMASRMRHLSPAIRRSNPVIFLRRNSRPRMVSRLTHSLAIHRSHSPLIRRKTFRRILTPRPRRFRWPMLRSLRISSLSQFRFVRHRRCPFQWPRPICRCRLEPILLRPFTQQRPFPSGQFPTIQSRRSQCNWRPLLPRCP